MENYGLFLLLLIYCLGGWNPLLCSSQTSYWIFLAFFAFHSITLGVLANLYDQCEKSIWLFVTWLCLFIWALAGDHTMTFFHLNAKTYLLISILLILFNIITYLTMKVYFVRDVIVEKMCNIIVDKLYDQFTEDTKKLKKSIEKFNFKLSIRDTDMDIFKKNLLDKIREGDPLVIMERNERRYQLLMKPLSDVPFFIDNPRILNALREHEVLSMFHLCQYDRNSMRKMHGIGMGSLSKIEDFLTSNDLSFGLDVFSIVKRHDLYAFYC